MSADRSKARPGGKFRTTDGETIFAPATGAGRAGVAVIRISGPQAGAALKKIARREIPKPRYATRITLTAADGETIDDGLAIWFPAPASFTGEDVAELHVHGGRAVMAGALEVLADCVGLRPAEPGEFTRRAFEHGKIDLTAAEGLADLVAAETAAQRRQAVRQMRGDLARTYDSWRQRLLATIAHIEATIDFSDEDLPAGIEQEVETAIARLAAEIGCHLEDGRRGERLREGIRVAIIGPPNAGKSSIFNVLAQREAAIVSSQPGTTRDVIEVALDMKGYLVLIADTAGLRQTREEVEREGVRRARMWAKEADLKLAVFDAGARPLVDPDTAALVDGDTVAVVNKSDLRGEQIAVKVAGQEALSVSALTGEGIDGMICRIEQTVARKFGVSEAPALTRVRHRAALKQCHESLVRANQGTEAEIVGEEVRMAARALGRITGRVDVEEILDVIFRDFCIGK